jgi:uncharacterized coiled-coil DUF342 family protein
MMKDLIEKVENIKKRLNELNDILDDIRKSLTKTLSKLHHLMHIKDLSGTLV